MQGMIPPGFREAARPFELPESFAGVRLYYQTEAAHAAHRRETCDKPGHPLCEIAALTDFRLRWQLAAGDGEVLREGEKVISGVLTDEAARDFAGAFLAWYIVVREVAEQNGARFHPASEIPATLLSESGERVPTPPHFFTS